MSSKSYHHHHLATFTRDQTPHLSPFSLQPMILPALSLDAVLASPELAKRYGVLGPFLLTSSSPLPQQVPTTLLQHHNILLGPFPLTQLEDTRPWLHDGAQKALFLIPHDLNLDDTLQELSSAALPRDRVGISLQVTPDDARNVDTLVERINTLSAGASMVLLQVLQGSVEGEDALVQLIKAVHQATRGKIQQLVVEAPSSLTWTAYGIATLHKAEVQTLISAAGEEQQQQGGGEGEALLPLAQAAVDGVDAFIACLRTDREDGLYTTVVVDECNVALGLVYSSAGSIRASVAEGRGIYYSRSRGGLWRKGDSSGAVQELVGMDMDCDSDALRCIVRQKGNPPAFCHLNRRNCWQEDKGLGALQRTLEARLKEAPEGSYTLRLFKDPELLRNKLVEEAQELSEAQEPEDVASEAADVMYFAMVRCVAAGVSLQDVERYLDARALKLARRPGNAKKERIEAAQAILGKGKEKGEKGGEEVVEGVSSSS